tara:strand:- start:497 stop:631 length:135 start_codon:yes stop_codon:yes gene_type:complete
MAMAHGTFVEYPAETFVTVLIFSKLVCQVANVLSIVTTIYGIGI